ncbi:ADM_collapsed_G0017590.mRNA.1.CDS.1 [Saccharomyces cerevisiae]|nr:ADM_collapsed_G0017590.mRNA.1.CDS.1 [Saccharomyces cerevisiae]
MTITSSMKKRQQKEKKKKKKMGMKMRVKTKMKTKTNDDDDDEDEEEEEEVTDQLEDLREHFKNTEEGKALVHHYEECAERVKIQQQQPGYADLEHKEDCVEEFFHLQHYLDTATAPRLFDKLK